MNQADIDAMMHSRCIRCKSYAVRYKSVDFEPGRVTQPAACEYCEYTWTEVYALECARDIKPPDQNPLER